MSDDDVANKLVGLLVPERAKSTKQGPRLYDTKGRFAPATFKEVNLAVVPEETVQWLSEGLPLIADAILRIEDRLGKGFGEIQSDLETLQRTADQILFCLNQDLLINLKDALKLLRRADRKGEATQEFLVANERTILKPLQKVEMVDEERLKDARLPPGVRTCLMKRLLMLRHAHARVLVACGDESDAHELLKKTCESILPLATALFAELINGVDVLNVPEADSPDNERKLLLLMEIIDGISPDDRRFRLKQSTPHPPEKINLVPLISLPRGAQETDGHEIPRVMPGTWVRKGQVIYGDSNFVWRTPVSGYLTVRDFDISSQAAATNYQLHPTDYRVLACPTLESPHPGLVDLITDLAFIVDYARGLDAESDLAFGNGELAKMLFAPNGGEPVT